MSLPGYDMWLQRGLDDEDDRPVKVTCPLCEWSHLFMNYEEAIEECEQDHSDFETEDRQRYSEPVELEQERINWEEFDPWAL